MASIKSSTSFKVSDNTHVDITRPKADLETTKVHNFETSQGSVIMPRIKELIR